VAERVRIAQRRDPQDSRRGRRLDRAAAPAQRVDVGADAPLAAAARLGVDDELLGPGPVLEAQLRIVGAHDEVACAARRLPRVLAQQARAGLGQAETREQRSDRPGQLLAWAHRRGSVRSYPRRRTAG
jgi:hypothetical protein